ncbi:hypothetical protein HK096_002189, partial [Nowakowskiella sp. JEL0078]
MIRSVFTSSRRSIGALPINLCARLGVNCRSLSQISFAKNSKNSKGENYSYLHWGMAGVAAASVILLQQQKSETEAEKTVAGVKGGIERTFIAVKPDGTQRALVGEILQRFEQKGYKLVAIKAVVPARTLAEAHYEDLKTRPFFKGLVDYMTSGKAPVIAMVWEGKDVIRQGRRIIGATNPFLEEMQSEMDILKYSMKGVKITACQKTKRFKLKVPGLAEKKPSIVFGDQMYASLFGSVENVEYEAIVIGVLKDELLLLFHDLFLERVFEEDMLFNVRFHFNRTPIRRMHLAIELASQIPRKLKFPTEVPSPPIISGLEKFKKFLNPEQAIAVSNIVNRTSGGVPYIIYGPPGTGT